jgi:hypothetical protein
MNDKGMFNAQCSIRNVQGRKRQGQGLDKIEKHSFKGVLFY